MQCEENNLLSKRVDYSELKYEQKLQFRILGNCLKFEIFSNGAAGPEESSGVKNFFKKC